MASFQQERNRVEEVASSKLVSNSNQSCSSPPSNNTSSSSSPSHEFSFTISLNSHHHHHHHHHHHSSFTNTNNNIFNSTKNNNNNIDLSPADEIFFHGHLLPLHLLSHLPQSPRSSSNSMDSFTLPIRELLEDENVNPIKENGTSNNIICNNNNNKEEGGDNKKNSRGNKLFKPSFSLFGLKKGPKGSSKVKEKEEKENHKKKRLNFYVIHDAMKKYLRMVQQPLVLFRRRSNSSRDKYRINGKSSYSYSSGNVTPNSNKDLFRGYWNHQYSAPASMRTSPTNSGLLVPTQTTLHSSHGARDSTMEELQAAIQAAIAHCKNSIAKEEKKLKCSEIRSSLI